VVSAKKGTLSSSDTKDVSASTVAKSEVDQLLKQSVSFSSVLAKSQLPESQRASRRSVSECCRNKKDTDGTAKPHFRFMQRADSLFEKLDDKSPEYSTMLSQYSQTLNESNKPDIAKRSNHRKPIKCNLTLTNYREIRGKYANNQAFYRSNSLYRMCAFDRV